MTAIVLDTNAASLVTVNRRIHHYRRAELQKHWRTAAKVAASGTRVHFDRAVITAEFRYPNRRRRDTPNLVPLVVKPAIDGIVDAGWLDDDCDDIVAEVRVRRADEFGPYRVTITVEAA